MDPAVIERWMRDIPEFGIYAMLAISSIIENVFPPWPGDTVTVFGGVLIARASAALLPSLVSLVIGNLIGAYIMYFLGSALLNKVRDLHDRLHGDSFIKKQLHNLTSERSMRRAQFMFHRWGSYYVLFSRFSAGIRFFISIVAGISRMNLLLFSIFFTLGVLIWNSLLLGGGFMLAKEWSRILDWLRLYNFIVFGILTIGLGAYLLYRNREKIFGKGS